MYKDKNISNFSIDGGFTGNRNIDKQKALDHIKKFGYDRIPTGYVLHHDIDNGVFKLIREDIHETFKHYGGYYYNK